MNLVYLPAEVLLFWLASFRLRFEDPLLVCRIEVSWARSLFIYRRDTAVVEFYFVLKLFATPTFLESALKYFTVAVELLGKFYGAGAFLKWPEKARPMND